ncbi:MAG TPA: cellulose biosynthesis cyclic di-GMP-binding regulatory protein BcsB [Anaerolineales bacterium]|nr:cellulose biosynthesis cyclic di-GMP-binding regulatory protein BcsB [Anaerolineales bacterium]
MICIWSIIAFLIPQRSAHSQDLNFIEIPIEKFHDQKPVQFLGLISSQTLNIPVPQSWLPGDENWLDIRVRVSPLLDLARSSFTITLNSLQVESYRLTRITRAEQRILIPANMFTQGNNSITMTSTLYLPDDQETNCQNWDDPARWLIIEPGGLLHLSFVRRDLSVDLSNFPDVFIEPLERYVLDRNARQALLVMPQNSLSDDLNALSTISYALGNGAGGDYDWRPKIVMESQFNSSIASNRNIVFIGKPPDEVRETASSGRNYVSLRPSPWGIGNAIMVIGDQDKEDGFSPASVLIDPARNILLHGNVAYIEPRTLPAPQPFLNDFSFQDLGYLDRTVRGIGQQNLIYSIYIPYDVDPTLVKLNLELVHSPDLDVLNSSFTVYLNGFSVAGILPTDRGASSTPITVGLPARRFRPGVNFVRVGFDLHLPHSSCERAPESVWATVLNSTALDVTYRNRPPIPSLGQFPLPFSDYPGFAFVIPDQYDQDDLGHISQLSFLMGNTSYRHNSLPAVMTAANFTQRETQYRNVILAGLPSKNPAIRSANDWLPQPFSADGDQLQDGFGVYLPTSDKDASLGLMQIIPSPWVKNGTILILTGNNPEGLNWAWDVALNPDPAVRAQFTGNLMVVGSANRTNASGSVSSPADQQTLFQQIADASNIPIIGPMLQRYGQGFVGPVLVAVGSALLLAIGLLLVMRTARNLRMPNRNDEKNEREEDER